MSGHQSNKWECSAGEEVCSERIARRSSLIDSALQRFDERGYFFPVNQVLHGDRDPLSFILSVDLVNHAVKFGFDRVPGNGILWLAQGTFDHHTVLSVESDDRPQRLAGMLSSTTMRKRGAKSATASSPRYSYAVQSLWPYSHATAGVRFDRSISCLPYLAQAALDIHVAAIGAAVGFQQTKVTLDGLCGADNT